MKFCVLNASPKGDYSTTLYTSLYLEKRFPSHSFRYVNIGQKISRWEKDPLEALEAMQEADVIVFSYPVYTFMAPSQLHRFIRVLKENHADLQGKYATQITTSKHFYDVTAHKYVEENCLDLGMKVIHGLSQDMEDLTSGKGREQADAFFRFLLWSVSHDVHEQNKLPPSAEAHHVPSFCAAEKKRGKEIVIVTDLRENDGELEGMVSDFEKISAYPTRRVNLRDFPFAGGCLGCLHCATSGQCVYKDGFDAFLRENIQSGAAIVYAFRIVDHSMGPLFKTYDDRQFCNGHRTVTEGMPMGYLCLGDIEKEANLKLIIEARADTGGNYLSGIATDADSLQAMNSKLAYALENHYVPPRSFYGVGGLKIFRDLIYLMRGIMKEDHVYYKKHHMYDFPQRRRGTMILMCLLGSLLRNKKVQKKMGNKMQEGMIAPYKKVLENVSPATEE